jgi:hypothetical protein
MDGVAYIFLFVSKTIELGISIWSQYIMHGTLKIDKVATQVF